MWVLWRGYERAGKLVKSLETWRGSYLGMKMVEYSEMKTGMNWETQKKSRVQHEKLISGNFIPC